MHTRRVRGGGQRWAAGGGRWKVAPSSLLPAATNRTERSQPPTEIQYTYIRKSTYHFGLRAASALGRTCCLLLLFLLFDARFFLEGGGGDNQ